MVIIFVLVENSSARRWTVHDLHETLKPVYFLKPKPVMMTRPLT